MTNRINIKNNKTSNETSSGRFDSRPFVMQSKSDNSKPGDLKTSLTQAEKFGHSLNKNDSTNQSSPTALQMKVETKQPIQCAPGITFSSLDEKNKKTGKMVRPEKPQAMKVKDPNLGTLTAHHKIDYSKLKSTVSSSGQQGKANLGQWADPQGQKSSPPSRQDVAWAGHNVFMGPLPENRADDPGNEIDSHLTKSGTVTPKSEAALKIEQKGGIGGISPGNLTTALQGLTDNQHSPFNANEWEPHPTKKTKAGEPMYQQTGTRIAGEKYGKDWEAMTVNDKVDYADKRKKEKRGQHSFRR